MKKEIGGEFWNIPLCDKDNHLFDDAVWFVSGRAAFRAILQHIKIQIGGLHSIKVAMPSYLCESMILPLQKENIDYKFYPVEFKDGVFECDYSGVRDCNVVLVIDYFGYDRTFNNNFSRLGKIIIRDLTHSIFTKKYDDADYYFGSLRKWAGFKCGGFAFKDGGKLLQPIESPDEYVVLRHEAMCLKEQYLKENKDEKTYLGIFNDAERLLDDCTIAHSILDDVEAAHRLDIDLIKSIRRRNAQILIDGLKDYCYVDSLNKNDCPLFVPIHINDRDKFRNYLIKNEVYCPSHWPKPFNGQCKSDKLYEEELSLVCDQRYSIRDMERIVSLARDYMENKKDA